MNLIGKRADGMEIINNIDDINTVINHWEWLGSDGEYSMYCNVFNERVLISEEAIEDYFNGECEIVW